ncbi:hypothetical protein D3C81_190700 [compost metagenome]
MFGLLSVKAKQTGVYVHITGISYYDLAKDIEKFYSTSLLTKHQIRKESWDTIKVHNFFLVELRNILTELLKVRNLRSRRRALAELQEVLEMETWLKDTVNPSGVPFDLKKLNRFHTTPFPAQLDFLQQYPVITNSYHLRGLLLDAKPGSGKAMPLTTKVKTPNGWAYIKDLKIGSAVMTPHGKVAKVTGVFPQGVTPVYRFHFEDGRVADSHPEHLWQVDEVSIVNGTESVSHDNVTTTQDIVDHFPEYQYRIPLVGKTGGFNFSETGTPQKAAGRLLLDGIPIDATVLELPYSERFAIAKSMVEFCACHVDDKALTLYHESLSAMNNFQKLMWSLGGIAHEPVEDQGLHSVTFKHRDIDVLIEGLVGSTPFIKERFNTKQYKDLKLKIAKIETRKEEETMCISIDSADKLFIVDDYVVTHNTFTSIAWAELCNDAPTVVLHPLNIVDEVWLTQLHKHYKVAPKIWSSTFGLPPTPGYDYYLVHYDYMAGQNGGSLQKFLTELSKKHQGQLKLIIDECHNFNDWKAARTRRLIEWGDAGIFGHVLPMSGTPLKALGSEVYPTLCLIDMFFDNKAREFFLASYGKNRPSLMDLLARRIGRSKFTIPELVGMGDPPPIELVKVQVPNSDKYTLDAIRLEMQVYINERIAFYNKHMPEFLEFYNEVVYSYELSIAKQPPLLEELARYKQIVHRFRTQGYNSFTDVQDGMFCKTVEEKMERDLKGNALKDFRNIKSAVKYLGLKLRGEALGNVLGRARINAIRDTIAHAGIPEMIDNVEKKTLIFTSYIDALKECEGYLERAGYPVITVYGENAHERDANIKRFAAEGRLRALVAVYDSLKEGYPLLMANLTILLNAPFRDHEVQQVQARTWRTGQDAPCFYKLLDMDTGHKLNITTRSINIMEWSRDQVDALLSKQQGHELLGNITGQEMFDMGDEPPTQALRSNTSVLSLF